MATWSEVEQDAPALAATVRACFAVGRHATMATLRRDGSPRISGTEVEWAGGDLLVGSMPGAVKARDLQRDGRVALHSPTVDPGAEDGSDWPGEAKVAGMAEELPTGDDAHRFRIDLAEVVHTGVEGGALVVTSWHPGRGLERRRRA